MRKANTLKDLIKSVARKELLLPLLRDFLAKEEAATTSGKVSKKAGVIHDAELTVKTFQARIGEFNHGEDPEGKFFHPSTIGACQRMMFFDHYQATRDAGKVNEDDLLRRYLIFETGTYIHVMFQNLCERAGFLIQRECAIVDRMRKILGHADGKLRIDGKVYVLEIKTINSKGFQMLHDSPKHEHKAQAHAYMRSLNVKHAIFIYYNKDQNSLREFVVDYDHSFYLEHVRRRIDGYFTAIDRKVIPPQEGTNPRSFPCMFCPFTKVCWESGRADAFLRQIKSAKYQALIKDLSHAKTSAKA